MTEPRQSAADAVPISALLSRVVAAVPCPVAASDAHGAVQASNSARDRMVGQRARSLRDIFPEVADMISQTGAVGAALLAAGPVRVCQDDAPQVEAASGQATAGETEDYRTTFPMFRADGTNRWTEKRGTVTRHGSGRPLRLIGMDHDITAWKADVDAMLARKSRLLQFIECASVGLAMFDTEMRCLAVSSRFVEDLGLPAAPPGNLAGRRLDEVLQQPPGAWIAMPPPVLAGEVRRQDDDACARADGTRESVCWSMAPWFSADGTVGGAVLAIQITTARKAAKAALAESEAKFRVLAELLPQLIFTARADGSSEYKNRRWLEYSGMTPEQARNGGWIGLLHPDDRDASVAAWNHAVRSGEPFEREHRLRGKDGEYRWFLARATPLREKADGPISRWIGTATEISGIVRAREAATRAAADLEVQVAERSRALEDTSAELQAEARLRGDIRAALMQSQKLETLGQLTASVAHDFNNVLAAIHGSFEIIARRVTGQPVARIVESGMEATKQAISLTRQLLDFARTRSLEPTVVDVALSIRKADKLIGHAVGPGIDRFLDIQQGVWPVLTDGDQLEVALLNLAINARDAMPDGGRLILEARNLASEERPETLPLNDYVGISVRDTGHGMPSEVVARATETFFTTKPQGKGTGLGLPMVQAFASRSGGMLRIDSQEGGGTIVTLTLPRAAVSRMDTPDSDPAPPENRGGGQM